MDSTIIKIPQDPEIRINREDAELFSVSLLTQYGVELGNAQIIAGCLVAADLRGIDTHGINRLPSYLARVRAGVLAADAVPEMKQITPAVAQIDGHNGFGFLSASLGIDTAILMAQTYGIGMVSIKNSNHFGMSAWVVQRAIDQNMMSLVFTNSSPALPAWGGKDRLLGVSPIACGAPGPSGGKPFILDMAPSVAARGKIYKALRRGEQIPEGWALDADGGPTTDPQAALGGTMLPMGGPKGSGLAIMMDVFSGVLSGSAFAGGVTNPHDPSKAANVGHFLVAIRPDLFMGLEEFRDRMQVLYDKVVGSSKMAGVDRIFFPGEIEQLTEVERKLGGIPFKRSEVESLNAEAARVGSERLRVKDREKDH